MCVRSLSVLFFVFSSVWTPTPPPFSFKVKLLFFPSRFFPLQVGNRIYRYRPHTRARAHLILLRCCGSLLRRPLTFFSHADDETSSTTISDARFNYYYYYFLFYLSIFTLSLLSLPSPRSILNYLLSPRRSRSFHRKVSKRVWAYVSVATHPPNPLYYYYCCCYKLFAPIVRDRVSPELVCVHSSCSSRFLLWICSLSLSLSLHDAYAVRAWYSVSWLFYIVGGRVQKIQRFYTKKSTETATQKEKKGNSFKQFWIIELDISVFFPSSTPKVCGKFIYKSGFLSTISSRL